MARVPADKENLGPRMSQSARADKGKGREEEEEDVDMLDGTQDDNTGADEEDDNEGEGDAAAEAETQKTRDLRAAYRALAESVEDTRKNIIDVSVEDMSRQIESANGLFKDVQKPAEAILDSKVLMAASDAGALKARQLKLDSSAFDTDEFLSKLVIFMGGRLGGRGVRTRGQAEEEEEDDSEEEDSDERWAKVGRVLAGESRRIPAVDHMWGPLATEVKEKKAKANRQKFKPDESQKTRPVELDQDDVTKDPQETTKMVTAVHKILANVDTVPLMQFIINPDSFAQTVENMFYFSFLVKEGHAGIGEDLDPESEYYGDIVCYQQDGAANDDDIAQGVKKHQLIFELTEQIWRDAIDAYDITESAIPTREIPVPAATAKGQKKAW